MRAFAIHLAGDQRRLATTTVERDALNGIVTELLIVAISQTDFYHDLPSPVPQHAEFSRSRRPHSSPSHALALECITQCLNSGNENLAVVVIDKLLSTIGQDPAIAQKRAKLVLLPLLPLLSSEFKKRTHPPALSLSKLAEAAVRLRLDSVTAKGSMAQDKIAAILQAVSIGGVPDLIPSL